MMNLEYLTLDEWTEWPLRYKALASVILCVVVALGLYCALITSPLTQLTQAQQREAKLKKEWLVKANVVSGLDLYQAQLHQAKSMLTDFVYQLPTKKELANLLEDINAIGTQNGLQFNSIQWGKTQQQGQLEQVPITIKVSGHYKQLGQFVAQITALPRIIVLDDLHLSSSLNNGMLQLDVVAKTYRYQEAK